MTQTISLTILDAVKASGISRTMIYEAMERGDLKAYKSGRRTLIAFADLDNYASNLLVYQAQGRTNVPEKTKARKIFTISYLFIFLLRELFLCLSI